MITKIVYEFNAVDHSHLIGQLASLFNSNNNVFDNATVKIEVEV